MAKRSAAMHAEEQESKSEDRMQRALAVSICSPIDNPQSAVSNPPYSRHDMPAPPAWACHPQSWAGHPGGFPSALSC